MKIITLSERKILWTGLVLLLCFRLVLLFFSVNYDADAVTRIWHVEDLWFNKTRLLHGTWACVYYLLYWPLSLFFVELEIPIRIASVLFGVGTVALITFYSLKVWGMGVAKYVPIVSLIMPVGTFCGTMSIASIPYAFFLFLTIFMIQNISKNANLRQFFLVGLILTLANGIRFEAWLLTGVICLFAWYHFGFKRAFMFGMGAAVFPIFWMSSSCIYRGDPLFSFSISQRCIQDFEGLILERGSLRLMEYKDLFGKFIGHGWVFLSLLGFFIMPKKRERVPLMVLLVIYVFLQCGGIYQQVMIFVKRYSYTLALLMTPYVCYFFFRFEKEMKNNFLKNSFAGFLLLSFVCAMGLNRTLEYKYVATESKLQKEALGILKENNEAKLPIIMDSIYWQQNLIIQQCGLSRRNIFIPPGAANIDINMRRLRSFIGKHGDVVVLVYRDLKGSEYIEAIDWNYNQIWGYPFEVLSKTDNFLLLKISANKELNDFI